jgi:hypothetical protein
MFGVAFCEVSSGHKRGIVARAGTKDGLPERFC